MRLICSFIPPDRGARKKRTICSRAMGGRGGDCETVRMHETHAPSNRLNMPAATETYSLGLPVEIGRIDQELKKLWEQGEGAMTRASLVNLAVYSEERDSLEKNTQLIAKIAENHACRAIVIGADCKTKQNRVEAWISAHCFLTPGFGPALLPLVAGGISRTDGRATLGLGRSCHLRQPNMEEFPRTNAPGRNRAARSQAADRTLRFELDAAG